MIRWLKPIVFLACLAPLARLAWKAYSGSLGANPIEVITHSTGDWTLIFLLVTLSVTPLRKADRPTLADSLPAHVRALLIFLRDSALPYLYLARQVF